jgi:hypothetical protein
MGKLTNAESQPKITQKDIDFERAEQWGRFRINLVWGITTVCSLWVVQYPFHWFSVCVHELAGKETNVSLGLTISLSVYGVGSLATIIVGGRKLSKQKQQLLDLRQRAGKLEGQLSECRKLSQKGG